MPNRIIKESICTSESVNQLSWFEEAFFQRLIVNCDDYGRMDARTAILKAKLFPLKNVSGKQINSALSRLEELGTVLLYQSGGKPYVQLVSWEKHQQVRCKKSKYPTPETCLISNDINYDQVTANVPVIQSDSVSENESISETNPYYSAEPKADSSPPVVTIPLNTGEEYMVTQEQADEWISLYPAADVLQELREMRGWCLANPKHRKTASGVQRFITGWLSKEQDRQKAPYAPRKKRIKDGPANFDADELVEFTLKHTYGQEI